MRRLSVGAVPAWFRNTAVLVVIYFAAVWGVSHWLFAWHDWDWQVFDKLKAAPTALPDQIALVDMQYADPADIPQHRRLLAKFIESAAAQRPSAIILDIPFGQCQPMPCTEAMESSRRVLIQAVDEAKRVTIGNDGVGVFANVGEMVLTTAGLPNGNAPALDPEIYRHFTGYGHTAAMPAGSGDFYYYPCYAAYPALFRGAMPSDVWALVDVALRHASDADDVCDQNTPVAMRYGPAISDRRKYRISAEKPFPAGADFAGKYVIVGVPAFDRHDLASTRSGPDLFAWIVADELANAQFKAPAILLPGTTLAFILPAFSALVVLAYVACFLFLKRLSLGATRPLLPWIATVSAFFIGVAGFIAFETWLLHLPAHQIQPQVALVSLGMLVAAILCGVRGWQIERELLGAIDDTAPPERYDYDVFLSYAHAEFDWVDQNVYRALMGAGLNVFFDKSSIHIGTAWQDRIALSIRHSRFVIAIYSEAYFSRPYCRYEIKRAHRKWVTSGEESVCVFPIMRGTVQIPEAVDDIQARSIDEDPELVRQVIDTIIGRLRPSAASPNVGLPL